MSSLLRSIAAAQKRMEREARSLQRELEQQKRNTENMQEYERALFEVQVYENQLDVLLSIQKECGSSWDWKAIKGSKPPEKPSRNNDLELTALSKLSSYKPNVFEKVLRKAELKRDQLKLATEEAKQADEINYQKALKNFEQELKEWKELTDIASRILSGQGDAYLEAINIVNPFGEINQLGSSMEIKYEHEVIEVTLHVNSEDVIPSDTRTLLKSGKLSVKKMSKTKFYGIYQDYVCGAVLRVARELFALLPIDMLIVTAIGSLLNTQIGHMEDQPILSIVIPRDTIDTLNFEMLDPSDSMSNFIHNMEFKNTSGFKRVERISPNDLQKK